MQTEITELLGIQYPIIQGGMAWVAEHHLAAAVSEAERPGTDRGGKRTGGMGAGADPCRKKSDGAAVRCEYYADESICR